MVFIDFCLNCAFLLMLHFPSSYTLGSHYCLPTPVLLHHAFQLHSLLFRASLKLYLEICHARCIIQNAHACNLFGLEPQKNKLEIYPTKKIHKPHCGYNN